MKAIVQRVLSASVTVGSQIVSSIDRGILVFAAVAPDDTAIDAEILANKILKLKVWDSEDGGRWKKSALDNGFQVLIVSQFTLLATTKKGNKPDFHGACPPALAKTIYSILVEKTRKQYKKERKLTTEEEVKHMVQDGVFGAMMMVGLVNDGPVTFEVATPAKGEVKQRKPSPGKGSREENTAEKGKCAGTIVGESNERLGGDGTVPNG